VKARRLGGSADRLREGESFVADDAQGLKFHQRPSP
jgi:hypothetical protein